MIIRFDQNNNHSLLFIGIFTMKDFNVLDIHRSNLRKDILDINLSGVYQLPILLEGEYVCSQELYLPPERSVKMVEESWKE